MIVIAPILDRESRNLHSESNLAIPVAEAPAVRRPGRLIGLQILRFLAAFAVVLFHIGSGYQAEFGNSVNPFVIGAAGVDVFFVLSGFIIAMTTDPSRGSGYFCRKRLARIVPLYWILTLGLAVVAVAAPSLINSTSVDMESVIKSLLFIPYVRPDGTIRPLLFLGWTLNYEMFFYAIYALCLWLRFRSPAIPAVLVCCLVLAGTLVRSDSVLWRFYTNWVMLEFALGIGLYLAYSKFPQIFTTRFSLYAGSFSLVLYALFSRVDGLPWLLASALPALLAVIGFLNVGRRSGRGMIFLTLCGDASYSLYLSHPYVIQLLAKVAPGDLTVLQQCVLALISSVLSIAVAIGLYRLIELPSQRMFGPRRLSA